MGIIQNVAPLRDEGLACARGIAEFYFRNQTRWREWDPSAGNIYFSYDPAGNPEVAATEWAMAFAAMGLFAAAKVFDEPKYRRAAEKMGEAIKTMQIFSPFLPRHYGAFREHSPQTTWCYVRDALSAAWGFVEFYRATGKEEYLERAVLWAEWFLREGRDAENWPLWGVDFEPPWPDGSALMRNDVAGDFSGGNLNFFYQLYKATGDRKWIGGFFVDFADRYIRYVQQADGYYRTIIKATKAVPAADPQGGLHKSNDDLSSLGLLCAFRAIGDRRYLEAAERFLAAVYRDQRPDGAFEKSVAGIPVVLNTIAEGEPLGIRHDFTPEREQKALRVLFSRRHSGEIYPLFEGGLDEYGDGGVCSRSSAYSLVVLLKLFAGENALLAAQK